MPDWWELMYSLDTSIDDAEVDSDHDGYDNIDEYNAGTAPDDASDYPDFIFDDDDDSNLPDPLKESPTDDSIDVEIEFIEYTLDRGGDYFELEQKTDGTTSGDVHHCSITYLEYYDDGSFKVEGWMDGPEIQDRTSFLGITIEFHFKGTGSGGKDDWSEWALYSYTRAPNSMYEEFLEEGSSGSSGDDGRTLTEAYVIVRAYSDAEESSWDQDSVELTDLYEQYLEGEEFSGRIGLGGEDDDDDSSSSLVLPVIAGCLGLAILAFIILILIFVFLRKMKKDTENTFQV
jgi:hypothetical protein